MGYYKLDGNSLKAVTGLVRVGDVWKNAQFLTDAEAAGIGAYQKANNRPEERDGYRVNADGYEVTDGKWVTRWGYEAITYTFQDYDDALEEHLEAEKSARGYTKRDPSLYANSTVERYRQDAADWTAHRDAVMLYGLEVENKAKRGEEVPTLAEFKAALPKITWTIAAEA